MKNFNKNSSFRNVSKDCAPKCELTNGHIDMLIYPKIKGGIL
jgi:hypothetical protein